ncbi:hypothetical protein TSUD_230200 [Trifolium subterraneum]|uniref:Uncharacterized protein n=1 Tax=Trifolium subterraneum TaxID=3900 RepID=A0A2Z6MD86_TRISU|nr:hypothetical protein TSUD_230200 [Trifolium subterraneum]
MASLLRQRNNLQTLSPQSPLSKQNSENSNSPLSKLHPQKQLVKTIHSPNLHKKPTVTKVMKTKKKNKKMN